MEPEDGEARTRMLRQTPSTSNHASPERRAISLRARWSLVVAALAIVIGVAASILITAAVVEIQTGATAYIIGEGHWSQARSSAVHHLYRYSLTGAPGDLAQAREALQVPLGDRRARLALDRRPPNIEEATQGFRDGLNAESNIPRIIWLYLRFNDAPYFGEALDVWRAAEVHLLQVVAIADRLERHWGQPDIGPAPDEIRDELLELSATIAPLERKFSHTLQVGSEWLRDVSLLGSANLFLLIAGAIMLSYALTLRRIRNAESLFRAAFMQSTVGMVKLMPDGRIIALNEQAERLLGLAPGAAVGASFQSLLMPVDPAELAALDLDWATLDAPIECRLRGRDGRAVWCRLTASTINERDRIASRVFVIVEDVSEARLLSESLSHQATHDPLTGLINRREIERRIEALLHDSALPWRRHTLCFLDLDQFKLVNDSSSHAAGDQLLRLVASSLPPRLGPADWAGRLGGDEFALLLTDTPIDEGVRVAERINRALAETSLLWEGRHFSLTSSTGLVEINAETPSVGWLLRAADTACYLAKESGRNQVRVYVESDREVARRHDEMSWANQIRAAIAEGRLRLFAQRIESLRPGSRDGLQYEVLVRMLDLAGNVCHPAVFLNAVERFDQAAAVDIKVLSMALEQLAMHPRHLEALELCHINVSGQSAASVAFRDQVIALLDASRVPPQKLCFELTETASIHAFGEARAFIDAMRSRGCSVALDDFGSGLSSFAYLKNLPVDILKIDGMFVRDIAHDPLDLAVVRAVTEVAHTLGKTVIAEWAETPEVIDRLREIGVDLAQGYALHSPEPMEDLVREQRNAAPIAAAAPPIG